jgi:hypothetical protein
MAAAYAYAQGCGPIPKELSWFYHIDLFHGNVQAVLGRPCLGAKEVRFMSLAYSDRKSVV